MILRAYLSRACTGGVIAGLVSVFALFAGMDSAGAVSPPSPVARQPETYRPRELTPEVAKVKAVGEILNDNYAKARIYAEIAQDSAITGLLDWRETLFVDHDGAFERIKAFIEQHPDWPATDTMRARAERSLDDWPRPAETVLAFFENKPPLTVTGKLVFADALKSVGRVAEATDIIRKLYHDEELSAALETRILKKWGSDLSASDEEERLAQRIYAQDLSGALRAAKRIGPGEEKMAKAAISLAKGQRDGLKLYEKLPETMKSQLPVLYGLTRYYRLADKEDLARKTALSAVSVTGRGYNASVWWEEKRVLVRDTIAKKDPSLYREAYEIARSHGNDGGLALVEGEFLSGWIALQFLKDPSTALPHFIALAEGNDRPVNISQGEYWAGRAYDAMGKREDAAKHYQRAGAHPATFYGQLARDRLGWVRVPDSVALSGEARVDALASLERSELFRATRLIAATKRTQFLPMFLQATMRQAKTYDEKVALVQWVSSSGLPHYALRLAKATSLEGIELGQQSFPAPNLDHVPLTEQPELALIYGIIRQESEFNPKAQSHVGARGLMQIMPKTARGLSRNYQADYDLVRLVKDPAYNVQLGSALLHELLTTFDGSYAMVIAAYNAGPAPVYRWIKQFGDPRKGEIDMLDWIEMIPYSETRAYVKRVMENVNVYRARFKEQEQQHREPDADALVAATQRDTKGDLQRQASCGFVNDPVSDASLCR
ncbi:lytic transglycosylase domain-containing protein [Rhodoligotrophos ferricapiens]|uniref:lytic transglycosylase domain-containing protein n=1 Tax=Rhodoligotrophos ferricapiens TaxID=3069264 RepID=UPI00315CA723